VERVGRVWRAQDFEGLAALLAPESRNIDRRRIVSTDLDRDSFLESFRPIFAQQISQTVTSETLATRGERLALTRVRFQWAEPGAGPSEIEHLQIVEVDAQGRMTAGVGLDPDALDAAYAALDARYAAGEAAAHPRVLAAHQSLLRTFASRDWAAVRALFAADLVIDDHRLLGFELVRGSTTYLRVIQSLVDLAPDARLRLDHIRTSHHALFVVGAWHGTREGGAFEIPWIGVTEHDALGRMQRVDQYDLDRLDEARARFEALSASAPRDPLAAFALPNAATAAMDRAQAAFDARDWAAVRAAYRADARIEDRRRGALTSQDVDGFVADGQQAARPGVRYQRQLVGSAGERVALERVLWRGDVPRGGGPFEVELLRLSEVDEAGRIVAEIRFDADDWRAAKREARARWLAADELAAAAGVGTSDFGEAFSDHDGARIRAAFADDIVVEDHRLAGVGHIEGAQPYVDALEALWLLAPDIQADGALGALPYARHGCVTVVRAFGTLPEGGAFENYYASVMIVERGRITRLEIFEFDDLDAALARFEELRPDPLHIPPNAASRARDRSVEAWRSRDWDALRALASPDFRFEDRSRRALVSGDVETWIENNRFMPPGSGERELIGTAGDRVALERVLWIGEPDGGAAELEHLRLTEVDLNGRIRASIRFDPDDRGTAFEEAQARFLAGEAAGDAGQAAIAAMPRAFNQRDWAALQRCLAEDFVLLDHRTLGLSELPVAEWLASYRAWVDLAPDMSFEVLRILRWNRHGGVSMGRAFGTHEGGAFEQVPALAVALTHGPLVQRYEFFDVGDSERALARFEELCAGLAEPPPETLPR
jgi:ketosteroid isomerase-like protein